MEDCPASHVTGGSTTQFFLGIMIVNCGKPFQPVFHGFSTVFSLKSSSVEDCWHSLCTLPRRLGIEAKAIGPMGARFMGFVNQHDWRVWVQYDFVRAIETCKIVPGIDDWPWKIPLMTNRGVLLSGLLGFTIIYIDLSGADVRPNFHWGFKFL